jgi:hypothetical protein
MNTAPASQWLVTIKSLKGVKRDEIKWNGVNEWLATREDKVTKGSCSRAWHTWTVSWPGNQRLPQWVRLFKCPEEDHPSSITLLD